MVFLGNEGPLGVPQQPIVFENARRLNALVVLVEHRYYGKQRQRQRQQQELHAVLPAVWYFACQIKPAAAGRHQRAAALAIRSAIKQHP